MLTGKNINYCDDDIEAYVAEVNARKKKHPNSFTDILKLEELLKIRGFSLKGHWHSVYRGMQFGICI